MDKEYLSKMYDELDEKIKESINVLLLESVEYAHKEGFSKATIPISMEGILGICSLDVFKKHVEGLGIPCYISDNTVTVDIT